MSRRSYDQTCSVAGALDLLGERWTLLIIRELLTGPKRYSDLLRCLRGVGTNLLAARLRGLIEDGLVQRDKLPPPAAAEVYQLTEAGRGLEPVLVELIRWGVQHQRRPRRGATYRPTWSVLAMRALFRPDRAAGKTLSCEFHVDDDVFHVELRDGKLSSDSGPARSPDVVVHTDAGTFRRFETGEPPRALARSARWQVEGDAAALHELRGLFELPENPRSGRRGAAARGRR